MSTPLTAEYDRLYTADIKRVIQTDRWPTNRLEAMVRFAKPGGRLLEIGCGDGETLEHLAPRYGSAVGIELSHIRADRSRARLKDHSNCQVYFSSLEHFLESCAEPFDCVICADVIEHVIDPVKAVKDIARICTSDAQLLLSTPNIAFLPRRLDLLFGRFPATSRPAHKFEGFARPIESTVLLDGGHLHYFTFSSLRDLLRTGGFETEKCYGFGRVAPRLRHFWPSLLSGNALISSKYSKHRQA